jgi:hypothetical protein
LTIGTTPQGFILYNHYQDGPGVDASPDGKLTIKVPGYYWAAASISFIGMTGVIYSFQIREDGEGNDFVASASGVTGGRVNVVVFAGGRPEKDAVLQLHFWANAANAVITPISVQFFAVSL